jgi:hypothetical protein
VVRELKQAGWPKARALIGGWAVWKKSGLTASGKNNS